MEQLKPQADMRSSDNWAQLILAVLARRAPQLNGVLVPETGTGECAFDVDLDGDGAAETKQAVGVDYQYLAVDRGCSGQKLYGVTFQLSQYPLIQSSEERAYRRMVSGQAIS